MYVSRASTALARDAAAELVAAVALHRKGREPCTHRHGADMVEVDRRDPLHDRVCGCQCHPLVVIGEEQRELVAAEPEGLAALAESRADLREDAVARRMPVAVVDLLEVVDVDEAERQRPRLLLRTQQLALEALVELTVIAEPGQRIREREAHRPQRAVRGALVQRDCEQRPDERHRQDRRTLPQDDEHQRRRRHERERHDGRADVRPHQLEVRLAAAERDRGGDQDDVDDIVGCGREHDSRYHCTDALAVDGSDQQTCGEGDESENCNVERDPLERSVLGELDDGCRREQKQSTGGPTEEHDRGNGEHEREREHAAAGLRVDRHGEALRERRSRGERGEADQRATAVCRGREGVTGRDEDTEARQTDRENEGVKPAGRDRL